MPPPPSHTVPHRLVSFLRTRTHARTHAAGGGDFSPLSSRQVSAETASTALQTLQALQDLVAIGGGGGGYSGYSNFGGGGGAAHAPPRCRDGEQARQHRGGAEDESRTRRSVNETARQGARSGVLQQRRPENNARGGGGGG